MLQEEQSNKSKNIKKKTEWKNLGAETQANAAIIEARIKKIIVTKIENYYYIHFYLKHPYNPKYIKRLEMISHRLLGNPNPTD